MNKILIISILALIINIPAPAQNQPKEQTVKASPLVEGFKFDRLDGLVTKDRKEDKWFFAPEKNLTDGRGLIPAGKKIQLLPSNTLQALAASVEKTPQSIRLSAAVTKYRSRNFLFPTYFLLGEEPEQITPPEEKQEQSQQDKTEDNSQQDSIIPADVLEKLKPRHRPLPKQAKQIIQTDADSILPSRTGFVKIDKQNKSFEVDALGRNVENISLQLLPCQVLERLENKIAESPYRQRYRLTGIVTKYKKDYYLLPQQATRTYNHGNFAR